MHGTSSEIKILIIDDAKTMRFTLDWMLKKDYHVHAAVDGYDGIDKYKEFKPDIILLDLNMPRLDGFGVLEHIRQKEGDQEIFIIILTAEESEGFEAKALNLGANDFLHKPINKVELLARVGVAERQVRLHHRLRTYLNRITREIDLIASLQSKLLPADDLHFQDRRVHSLYKPSGQASGDYFDYFPLSDTSLRVAVADVSGHGAGAAFIMAVVRTLFRSTQVDFLDLPSTLSRINNELIRILGEESDFITVFAADVDFKNNQLTYINAGHCPGMLKTDKSSVRALDPNHPLLGFFEIDFTPSVVPFTAESELLLYTDGFYEWEPTPGKIIEPEEFWDMAKELLLDTGDLFDKLLNRLAALAKDECVFRDDLTAVWITGAAS